MSGNSQAHQIRLAGPWQNETNSAANERSKLPFVGQNTGKPLIVRRAFNGSEGILAAKQIKVRIVFQGTPPQVRLNQHQLTSRIEATNEAHLEFDVTSFVAKSNSLTLTCADQAEDRVTDVCLLIFDD